MSIHNTDARPVWEKIFGLPSTRLGWWSVGLLAGALAFFGLAQGLVLAGERGGDTFLDNPRLALTMLAALICVLGSGGAAALVILRKGERSFLDLIGLLLGLLALTFLIGELLVPH